MKVKASSKSRERAAKIKELDGLLRKFVLARECYACEKCGSRTETLQAAHVLSKGPSSRLRFEPDNIMCLCLKDHLYFWHKSPHEAVAWFNEKYPGRYERLQIAARCAPKLDLKNLLVVWRAEVARLEK